jgi:hypothetical protein
MQQFSQFGRHLTRQRPQYAALGFVVVPALLFEHRLSLDSVHGLSNTSIVSFRR